LRRAGGCVAPHNCRYANEGACSGSRKHGAQAVAPQQRGRDVSASHVCVISDRLRPCKRPGRLRHPQSPSMSSGSGAADCWLLGRLNSGLQGSWDPLEPSGSSISSRQPRTVFALPTHPQNRGRVTGKLICRRKLNCKSRNRGSEGHASKRGTMLACCAIIVDGPTSARRRLWSPICCSQGLSPRHQRVSPPAFQQRRRDQNSWRHSAAAWRSAGLRPLLQPGARPSPPCRGPWLPPAVCSGASAAVCR
jgi:hypothetical protein